MLLFSRTVTLSGSPRKTIPWAIAITDYINANGTLPVSCWSSTFGQPLGTVVWSARVESQAQFASATATLLSDSDYLDLIDQAGEFATVPGHDSLREIVYGTPGNPPALGSVAQLTTATAIVDRMADAVAWSVEVAQHAESVMASPVYVSIERFGQMGTITWLGIVPDMDAADTAAGKLAADSTYLGRLAATKGLFIPGSGHVAQAVRIA
jgi:hypothetical protein